MQRAYISKLMELAEQDRNVLHLVADSGTGFDEMLRRNFPEQMYNFGICEEHMVAAAAGMATAGKTPFVYTAGAFLAYRALEFIRDDVCFQNLNVKIVGMGSGLAWSTLGPSHHTTEDISVLRAIPNLVILSPATPQQVSACVEYAYRHKGPVYLKIGMNNEKEFYEETEAICPEKNSQLMEGNKVVLWTTGSILEEAAEAVKMLQSDGEDVGLMNVCSIKPFDTESLLQKAVKAEMFVTLEEHNIMGGLGSIIAETLAECNKSVRLKRLGLMDKFAEGYGTQSDVRAANGLDAKSIYETIKRWMNE